VAHEERNLNSLGAILGNDLAIKAYREGKLPCADGTIIAALQWRHVPSEENNKIFGRSQSFVAGLSTNVQFMVKDSKKYASTGGWGFGHFNERDGKPAERALLQTPGPTSRRSSTPTRSPWWRSASAAASPTPACSPSRAGSAGPSGSPRTPSPGARRSVGTSRRPSPSGHFLVLENHGVVTGGATLAHALMPSIASKSSNRPPRR
jgi:hypothetical protein